MLVRTGVGDKIYVVNAIVLQSEFGIPEYGFAFTNQQYVGTALDTLENLKFFGIKRQANVVKYCIWIEAFSRTMGSIKGMV